MILLNWPVPDHNKNSNHVHGFWNTRSMYVDKLGHRWFRYDILKWPVTGELPSQKPVTWSVDVFFDLGLNKRLSKQSRHWWLKTWPRSLWRHSNAIIQSDFFIIYAEICMSWLQQGVHIRKWWLMRWNEVYIECDYIYHRIMRNN